ncbi:urease accessory protein UreF [Tropicimonas marinistellae]|uniref:urease accessory protein UreF n=1 Tax=Tropicimonas marinistellae TaxID=1739787 RepID=UPI0008311255|nr:urease accessory UreF family protein [Tropicimonas marinistellae]
MSDADLLTLTQWLSPAFPVGAYAYSHGLEAAVAAGEVATASGLAVWLEDVLRFGSGRNDAILLSLAMRGAAAADELSALAEALASSEERHRETMEQGAAFVRAVNALTGRDLAPMALPVAVGAATAALSLPVERVAALYLHAFASNLVSAAVRFVPLGQTEGQRVLAGLHAAIAEVAEDAAGAARDDIGSAAFGADLAAMRHERQDVRIFKT